jgi:23S rRNA pseudouridine1911/1915/1917 synthase
MAHSVERHYETLVWGALAARRGVIDAPIARSQTRRTRMAVRDEGRAARTHYEVHAHWRRPGVSRLECRLETGRTHQIRVHLAAIDLPVVGDPTYGVTDERLKRQFLHAWRLAFPHPVTDETVEAESPLPADLQAALARFDS